MRQSVALPRMIYELIRGLKNPEHQLLAYQTIFDALFSNREIDYYSEAIPDDVRNILIVAKYRIKEMKEKYEYGCIEKTLSAGIPFACKNKTSSTEVNQGKQSPHARVEKNKNINNINSIQKNKFINYNNNQSICLSEEQGDEFEFDEPTRINLYLQDLCEQIHEYDKLTKFVNAELCLRLEKLFRKLAKSSEPIGIGDDILLPVQILDKISGAFPRARNLGRFMNRFNELCKYAETSARNQYRYLVASIYNEI